MGLIVGKVRNVVGSKKARCEILNLAQVKKLIGSKESVGAALLACTPRASNAVDIILWRFGNREVDNVAHFININTPCENVCGN